ncbi:NAD(+) kinase [Actinobaculum suis]|uniref:NAD kinase n=1 Tax=Actinobaculum suis TaxID=1657 RepID=A0A0K9ERY0_9ACTO|nr:NAD kinase [Actinobaculum suis]KMY22635.1 ATP-NAD kinase [Actinobaculum suis]OCA93848.1 ATP-NAD kinase [Actinobaculum suis]OCA93983.1 ATP-NAD kinase [Actinobaculum suis]VDG76559.1 NAD(+) kinase [Actinobaculum suis]
MSKQRKVSLVVNQALPENLVQSAQRAKELFTELGVKIDETETLEGAAGSDIILVLGGDGTLLRGAEIGRQVDAPVMAINYGHMGFLSEAEPAALPQVARRIAAGDWRVEERMTVDVMVRHPDGHTETGWALNEASVEKDSGSRLIEVSIGVDGRELSAFKADSVLISTPTGSTAYNFSAGGPVVWPDVEAMLLTPVAAHALFTRPLVVGPDSELEVRILRAGSIIWCDGRRGLAAPPGSVIRAVRGSIPVKLARLSDVPFSGRLVTRFELPVKGWSQTEVGQ